MVAGYSAYRLGWVSRTPRIIWTLVGGYALASLLTFLNVWVTARLMFTSQHDLLLATVLLLFAGGIAMSLGYFLSAGLRDSLTALNRAAQAIGRRRLDTRVPVVGDNEIADLGRSFNRMAAQLEATAEKQRELETLRRDLIAWVGPRPAHAAVLHPRHRRGAGRRHGRGPGHGRALPAHGPPGRPLALAAHRRPVRDGPARRRRPAAGPCAQLDRRPGLGHHRELFGPGRRRRGSGWQAAPSRAWTRCSIDAGKIGRVLANLVDNALRHTRAGRQRAGRRRPP